MRGVVAAALRDRPALEQPHDRDERRVEDRDGEHEHRQDERRDRRGRDLPARRQAERGEREAEQLRAGVAHEDERLLAGAQVERQEAEDARAERDGDDEHEPRLVLEPGVDREERERDHGEARREPVHVVEQVEGVRHPDEPDDAERPREQRGVDELHVGAGREDDRSRTELRGELRGGRQRAQVVDEPGEEEEGRAGVDAGELLRGRERPGGDGQPDAGSECRRRCRCRRGAASRGRASGLRRARARGCASTGSAGAPRRRERGRERGEGREGAHPTRG